MIRGSQCVCLKMLFCYFLSFGFLHTESFFSQKLCNCVCVHIWVNGGTTMQGQPVCSLLYTSLLQSSCAVCSTLYPLMLSTIPLFPSQLCCAALSLGQWSTNITCSAPRCSKKPLSTWGATNMSLTSMEKSLPISAFCPQAWKVGVHTWVGNAATELWH